MVDKIKALTREMETGLPQQYQGLLEDGRYYYIKFKDDLLSLAIGRTLDEAIDNSVSDETCYALLDVKWADDPYWIEYKALCNLLAHVIELPEHN